MRIALFQPDIPQNAAAVVRLCACFGVPLDVIGPLGFVWDDKRLKRVGMDYLAHAEIAHHVSWEAFLESRGEARLVLLTTRGATPLPEFAFSAADVLVLGRESAGVPDEVHAAADACVAVPIRAVARSLNVAQTAAIALAEGLRQTHGFPKR